MESLSTLNPLDENEITHNIIDLFKAPLETVKLGFKFSFLWAQFLWPVLEALDAGPSLLSRRPALGGWERGGTGPSFLLSFPSSSWHLWPEEQHRASGWLGRGSVSLSTSGLAPCCQASSRQLFSKAHPLSWKTKIWVTCSGGVCKSKEWNLLPLLANPEQRECLPSPGILCTWLIWSQPPGLT